MSPTADTQAGAEHFARLVKALLEDDRARTQKATADLAQGIVQLRHELASGFGEQAELLGSLMSQVAKLDARVGKLETSIVSLGARIERVEAEIKLVRIEEQSTRQQVILMRADQDRLNERVRRLEERVDAVEVKESA